MSKLASNNDKHQVKQETRFLQHNLACIAKINFCYHGEERVQYIRFVSRVVDIFGAFYFNFRGRHLIGVFY